MAYKTSTLRGAAHMFAGMVALYTLVAACSAGAGGDGSFAQLADAMISPVADAKAGGVVSGSRLKATFIVGSDGSKRIDPDVFWDAELGETCQFTELADGESYCVPRHAEAHMSDEATKLYADASCSKEIPGYVSDLVCVADKMPTYAVVLENAFCGTAGRIKKIYKRGAPISELRRIYSFSGGCDRHVGFDVQAFGLGAEVPFSALVKGTRGHE